MNLCLAVDITVTLMRLTDMGYVGSGDKVFRYFFRVPGDWQNDHRERANFIAEKMYADLAQHFRLQEPDDPNYIAVMATDSMILSGDEIAAAPWLDTQPPAWEHSPCVIVNEENDYRKIDTEMFGMFFQ